MSALAAPELRRSTPNFTWWGGMPEAGAQARKALSRVKKRLVLLLLSLVVFDAVFIKAGVGGEHAARGLFDRPFQTRWGFVFELCRGRSRPM